MGLFVIAFSCIGVLYLKRNTILKEFVEKKITKFTSEHNVDIKFDDICLEDISTLNIKSFVVNEPGKDILLGIDSIKCEISIPQVIKGKIALNSLYIRGVNITVIDTFRYDNFKGITKSRGGKTIEANKGKQTPLYDKIANATSSIFALLPDDLSINELRLNLTKNTHYANAYLPNLSIQNNKFDSDVQLECDSSNIQKFKLIGDFNSNEKNINCSIFTKEKDSLLCLPLINRMYNAEIKCDTLDFSMKIDLEDDKPINLTGLAAVNNLVINWQRLSPKEINIEESDFEYSINIGKNYIEIDSLSTFSLNSLSFNPYLKIQKDTSLYVTLSINKDTFPSEQLFNSIPHNLFTNLDSMVVSGDLDFHLYFHLDTSHIDSLQFYSSLNKHNNFKIEKFGHTDFGYVKKQFFYNAYDNDRLVRSFFIGPDWVNYTPIDGVSNYLKKAILFSEDNKFFFHKGFYDGAFRYALIQNIKQKRFARGGSTISMQLVKNLFLNQNKNLMRKMEEILIVWLIENNRLIDKSRMFEIYLNIIEWGPNVYGAEEATQFYFNKSAANINPAEAIFLASIIPSPKKFAYRFVSANEVKSSMDYYFKNVGRKMLDAGDITGEEYESLSRVSIEIVGPAKNYLPKPKSSTSNIEEEDGDSLIELDE